MAARRSGVRGLVETLLIFVFVFGLLVVTVISRTKLFQSKSIGTVSFTIWVLFFISGTASWFIGLLIFGWTAYLQREWFLSWYYSLTPHPAARIAPRPR